MKKLTRLTQFACFLSLAAAVVAVCSGCTPLGHNRRAQVELREENSKQRSRIYRDRARMEEFQRENDLLRRRVEELQSQLDTRQQTPNRMRQIGPATTSDSAVRGQSTIDTPPRRETARTFVAAPETSAVPATPPPVEKGPAALEVPDDLFKDAPADDPLELPDFLPSPMPIHPATGSNVQLPATNDALPKRIVVRKTDSSSVYRVRLMKAHVRPVNYDGLQLEFQMLDVDNQIVLAAAPVSVMVMDPTVAGEPLQIGRWNFTAEEIAESINAGEAAISVPLGMAWRRGCPQNLKLQIHLMYTTSDGRMLVDRVYVDLEELAFAAAPKHTLADATPNSFPPAEIAPTVGHIGGNAGSATPAPTPSIPLERPVWTPEAE